MGFIHSSMAKADCPGVSNIFGKGEVSVQVPDEEVEDVALLAAELLKEMVVGDA